MGRIRWVRALRIGTVASLLVIPISVAQAQQASLQAVTDGAVIDPTAMKAAVAVRALEAPHLDGRMDEEIWASAPVFDAF